MTGTERATLRDLFDAVDGMRQEMNDGFRAIDSRLTPVEHYVTADKARNETWAAFRGGVIKVMTVVAGVVGAAVAAATLILTIVRMIV